MQKLLMVAMFTISTFGCINAGSNNEENSDYKMAIKALKESGIDFSEAKNLQSQVEALDSIENRSKEKCLEAFDKLDQAEAMIGLPKGFIFSIYLQAMPLGLDFIEIIPTELFEATPEEKDCFSKKNNLLNEYLKAGDNTESRNAYAEKAEQIYTQCYETDKLSLQKGFAIASDPVAAIEKLGEEKFNKMTAAFKAKFQEKQPEIQLLANKVMPYVMIIQMGIQAQKQMAQQKAEMAEERIALYQKLKDQI